MKYPPKPLPNPTSLASNSMTVNTPYYFDPLNHRLAAIVEDENRNEDINEEFQDSIEDSEIATDEEGGNIHKDN